MHKRPQKSHHKNMTQKSYLIPFKFRFVLCGSLAKGPSRDVMCTYMRKPFLNSFKNKLTFASPWLKIQHQNFQKVKYCPNTHNDHIFGISHPENLCFLTLLKITLLLRLESPWLKIQHQNFQNFSFHIGISRVKRKINWNGVKFVMQFM